MTAKLEIAARVEKAWGFPKSKRAPTDRGVPLSSMLAQIERKRDELANEYDQFVDAFHARFKAVIGKDMELIFPKSGPAIKVGPNIVQDLQHFEHLYPGKASQLFGSKISADEFKRLLQIATLSL